MFDHFKRQIRNLLKGEQTLINRSISDFTREHPENIYMTKDQYNRLALLDMYNFNEDFTRYRGKLIKIID